MANIPTNESIELELGVPQQVSLPQSGMWIFKPQSPNQIIKASLNPSMDNAWSSRDFGGKLPVTAGANGITVWIEVVELAGSPTCNVFYSNCFGQNFFNLGGGSASLTFSSPLQNNNGNVILNIANDLQVTQQGTLALDLQNNSEFSNLVNLVQSITSGVEIIGLIPNTNAEVIANTQLLTNFVQTQKGRAPRGGDVVLTTEPNNNPSFVWLFTSSSAWIGIGTTGAGIATNTTLGLIKGSDTITIGSDGSASVQNVVLLTDNQTIGGSKTFTGNAVFNNRVSINTGSGVTDYSMRFVGDSWASGQSTSLIGFWKGGLVAGYKMVLSGTSFNYAELWGLTLISNMKDPTEASHGANKRYVDAKVEASTRTFQSTDTITTANLPVGEYGYKLSIL